MDGRKDKTCLQDKALLVAALAAGAGHEGGTSGVLKDLTNTVAGSGRALQVLVGSDLLSNSLSVLSGNRLLVGCPQGLDGVGVVSQIVLAADQDDGETRAEVHDLRDPLLKDVVQRIRRVDGEADQDDVRVRVRERSETVVIFLASRIPQGQLNVLVVNLNVGDIVLENGGDVDLERYYTSASRWLWGSM